MSLQEGSKVYLTKSKAEETRDNNLISAFNEKNLKVLSGVIQEINGNKAWVSFPEANTERGNSGQYSVALSYLTSAN